jgi:hypothetical protein
VTQRILTGDVALDRRLAELPVGPANRAARAGLLKGARLAAKLIKRKIPAQYKGIRASIGSSVKKSRGGVTTAKAGAAVGSAAKKAANPRQPGSKRPGVGISSRNVHWYLLGTDIRFRKDDMPTGAMPASPAVRKAMEGGKPEVLAAIVEGAGARLVKEIAKLARKHGSR